MDFFQVSQGQAGQGGFEQAGMDEHTLVGQGVKSQVTVDKIDKKAQQEDVGGNRKRENAPKLILKRDVADGGFKFP